MATVEGQLDSALEGIAHLRRFYTEEAGTEFRDEELAPDTHLAKIDALVWELIDAIELDHPSFRAL